MASGVYPCKEPVMRHGGKRVNLRRKWLFNLSLPFDLEAIRPPLGQNSSDSAALHGVHDSSCHGLRIRDDDASKANVNDLLSFRSRFVDELQE